MPPDLVVVTRPVTAAEETGARLTALGWRPLVAPLIEIRQQTAAIDTDIQAVLVTSMNGLAGLPNRLHDKPLFCVGDATAGRAGAAGFRHVFSASGTSAELVALLAQSLPPSGKPILLACGAGQGFGLVSSLRGLGYPVLRSVLYAVSPVSDLPLALVAALAGRSVRTMLFYSAETARAFVAAAQKAASNGEPLDELPPAIAISRKAADALAPLAWREIIVAAAPNEAAMLALLPGRNHRG